MSTQIPIDDWNPYSLLPEAPSDEFDSKSMKITSLISEFSNADEIEENSICVF